jgi:hypothetical protein
VFTDSSISLFWTDRRKLHAFSAKKFEIRHDAR